MSQLPLMMQRLERLRGEGDEGRAALRALQD
jgi:hypothetical protein